MIIKHLEMCSRLNYNIIGLFLCFPQYWKYIGFISFIFHVYFINIQFADSDIVKRYNNLSYIPRLNVNKLC